MGRKEFFLIKQNMTKIHSASYLVAFTFGFFGDFPFWKPCVIFSMLSFEVDIVWAFGAFAASIFQSNFPSTMILR